MAIGQLDQIANLLFSINRLYGFQTSLAIGHLFQGLVDLFLTTPEVGIEDIFVMPNGKLFNVQLSAEYHWLNSDSDFTATGSAPISNQFGKQL